MWLTLHAFQGDKEQAAQRILTLFRQSYLGKIALELPSDAQRPYHRGQ